MTLGTEGLMKTGILFASLMACTVLVGCGPSAEEIAAAEEAASVRNLASAAQEKVKSYMFDPASAEFRNVFYSDVDGHRYICGEYNGNNRLGGKAGFTAFIAGNSINNPAELAISSPSHGTATIDAARPCRARWLEYFKADESQKTGLSQRLNAEGCFANNYDAGFWMQGWEILCAAPRPIPEPD